jgi:ligand-binding sensor protein
MIRIIYCNEFNPQPRSEARREETELGEGAENRETGKPKECASDLIAVDFPEVN